MDVISNSFSRQGVSTMESVHEPVNTDSNVWLRILWYSGVLVYYLVYPIILLLWSLLSLLLSFLGIISAPFVYIGRAIFYVIGAPFRFLAKFEVNLVLLERGYRSLNVS
jgi:hypothetical protein